MTGFFNPHGNAIHRAHRTNLTIVIDVYFHTGFLTAMRQEVTRTHKGWSLDTVIIDNTVLHAYKDDIREAPVEVHQMIDTFRIVH
jgi:hypothetical protein